MATDSSSLLRTAVRDVLMCPDCDGSLSISPEGGQLSCNHCSKSWPVDNGIIHLMYGDLSTQEAEWRLREDTMKRHQSGKDQILAVVAKHHCLRVMYEKARMFRSRFRPEEWILDLGAGTSWYWSRSGGARLILADFSLESLRVARQLLGDSQPAIFLWTNAQRLPLKTKAISGLWSVQVFQHFPESILQSVQGELDRVLRDNFAIEVYNLNPAVLHKAIYRLMGRRLHCHGSLGEMELNRLSPHEWKQVWREFRGGRGRISSNYSELFFHPDLRFRPQHYPIGLEHTLTKYVPRLAGLFARQTQVRIDTRAVG